VERNPARRPGRAHSGWVAVDTGLPKLAWLKVVDRARTVGGHHPFLPARPLEPVATQANRSFKSPPCLTGPASLRRLPGQLGGQPDRLLAHLVATVGRGAVA
jgi:hypothetical protein